MLRQWTHSVTLWIRLSAFCVLTCVAGCSSERELVPVTGTITSQGKPAVGALLMFHPDGNPTGVTSSGTAGEDGTFVLTSGVDKGITPGTYTVTVVWPDPSVKPTAAQMMQGMIEAGPDLLKGAYASKDVSTLKAVIDGATTVLPPIEVSGP